MSGPYLTEAGLPGEMVFGERVESRGRDMRCLECRHERNKEVQMLAARRTLPSREHPGRWEELRGVECPLCGRFVADDGGPTLISQGEARRRGLADLSPFITGSS